MRIQLLYTDPSSQTPLRPVLEVPVAVGSSFGDMPNLLGGDRVSRITLGHAQIAPYHVLLTIAQGRLQAVDQDSPAGIRVNGQSQKIAYLNEGDRLQVGPCEMQIRIIDPTTPTPAEATPEATAPTSLPPFENTAPASPPPPPATPPSLDPVPSVGGGCDRRIGFLFPRRCGRLSPTGCPHCQGGRRSEEPYFTYNRERNFYPDYGDYTTVSWGNRGYADAEVDFTEADAASLELLGDDFEQDMGAS